MDEVCGRIDISPPMFLLLRIISTPIATITFCELPFQIGMELTGINPLKVSINPLIDACHEVAARLKALKGQPMVDEVAILLFIF